MAYLATCRTGCGPNTAVPVLAAPPCYACEGNPFDPELPPPVMDITCPLVPATAVIGAADAQIAVHGVNFTPASVVHVDGAAAPGSTYVSATQMHYTSASATEVAARTAQISVVDGAATSATTCPFVFTATAGEETAAAQEQHSRRDRRHRDHDEA